MCSLSAYFLLLHSYAQSYMHKLCSAGYNENNRILSILGNDDDDDKRRGLYVQL